MNFSFDFTKLRFISTYLETSLIIDMFVPLELIIKIELLIKLNQAYNYISYYWVLLNYLINY